MIQTIPSTPIRLTLARRFRARIASASADSRWRIRRFGQSIRGDCDDGCVLGEVTRVTLLFSSSSHS
jgi:hypothetical protein